MESYEFFGVPGTTFRYGEIPTQPAYPYSYGYGPYMDPQGRVYQGRSMPGQPRYTYFGEEVRCDDLDRSCARWSSKRGAFVPDLAATQQLYGGIIPSPYDTRRLR